MKRIKRNLTKTECIKSFIESDELVYYSDKLCVYKNALFTSTIIKQYIKCWSYKEAVDAFRSKEELEMSMINSNNPIALINRDTKEILIASKIYPFDISYDLIKALPSDYKLYRTSNTSLKLSMLYNKTFCIKESLVFYLNKMIKDCNQEYLVLNNKQFKSVCLGTKFIQYANGTFETYWNNYKESNPFVRYRIIYEEAISLGHEDALRNPINVKYSPARYKGWSGCEYYPTITINKSYTEIYNHHLFNIDEIKYLSQCDFWCKYCRGFQIPFKDVIDNWNESSHDISKADKFLFERNNQIIYSSWRQFIIDRCLLLTKERR